MISTSPVLDPHAKQTSIKQLSTDPDRDFRLSVLELLEERRRGRTYAELATEIGLSRPMLRMFDLYEMSPGLDSIAVLIAWDEDAFLPIATEFLKRKGRAIRNKDRKKRSAT